MQHPIDAHIYIRQNLYKRIPILIANVFVFATITPGGYMLERSMIFNSLKVLPYMELS